MQGSLYIYFFFLILWSHVAGGGSGRVDGGGGRKVVGGGRKVVGGGGSGGGYRWL